MDNTAHFQTVNLQDISDDSFYRFSNRSEQVSSKLKNSIQYSGIRTPVSLIKKGEKYQILAGFSRIEIAQELNLGAVPAYLVEEKHAQQCFYHILLEHHAGRNLHLLEKARVLEIVGIESRDLFEEHEQILKKIDIPSQNSLIQDMRRLLNLHPKARDYLARYDCALKQAALFFQFTTDEQEILVDLAGSLQMRPVELQEVSTQWKEIAESDKSGVREVYDQIGVDSILSENFSRGRKIAEIRDVFSRMRSPRLTAWNDSIEQARKKLNLHGGQTTMKWDKSLERPGIALQSSFKNFEDVQKFSDSLQKAVKGGGFQKIFEVL